MSHQTHVSFIGAGEIGASLAVLVAHSGAHVELWDADQKKVPNQKSLEQVVSNADVLFLCVPSWILRIAVKPIIPFLHKKTLCVFVSKGIEVDSFLFVDGLAKKTLPKGQPFVLLSGPMLAEELVDGHGGAACVATTSVSDFKKIQKIFSCNDLHLTHAPNVKSVAVAGVLKNVYAIALGIAAGLNWGDNRKGWLVTESVQEMIVIMKALKADPSYVFTQAGIGDYFATGMSKYSSNQTLGRKLVEKVHCELKSEGCVALPSLIKILGTKTMKSLPILSALRNTIEKGKNVKDEFDSIFCA